MKPHPSTKTPDPKVNWISPITVEAAILILMMYTQNDVPESQRTEIDNVFIPHDPIPHHTDNTESPDSQINDGMCQC
jgi:hypothetical protein